MISVSVISHGHASMIGALVSQLLEFPEVSEVIITKNIPENVGLFPDARLRIVSNEEPYGFGKNHNRAFDICNGKYFCPLNPDIKFITNPFPRLIQTIDDCEAALAVPVVLNVLGQIEDSIRYYPRVSSLAKKLLFNDAGAYHIGNSEESFFPEWAAGMFMLFSSTAYKAISGFDEEYFLYYEDVDICIRIWNSGFRIVADPRVTVIHDARRSSRTNLIYMRWHVRSAVRYLVKHWGRLPRVLVR